MQEEPELEQQEQEIVDPSHALDLVTVFDAIGAEAEMEAMAVHGMLTAAGLDAVLVGSSALPNLPFAVQVPAAQKEEAERRIEQARAEGASAAEEAERASEIVSHAQGEQPPADA